MSSDDYLVNDRVGAREHGRQGNDRALDVVGRADLDVPLAPLVHDRLEQGSSQRFHHGRCVHAGERGDHAQQALDERGVLGRGESGGHQAEDLWHGVVGEMRHQRKHNTAHVLRTAVGRLRAEQILDDLDERRDARLDGAVPDAELQARAHERRHGRHDVFVCSSADL